MSKGRRRRPELRQKLKAAALLIPALGLLTWRAADLTKELIDGPVKMSLDGFVLTGNSAAAFQLLIIAALLCAVLKAASVIGVSPRK